MGDRDVTGFLDNGGDPEELIRAVDGTAPDPSGPRRRSIRLADVAPEPVEWLWPLYLPCGALTCLAGLPGQGKTTIVADLAARLSTGGVWPDGTRVTAAGDVLLLSFEDSARLLRSRIEAASGDLTRVHVLPLFSGEAGNEVPLSFPDGLATVEEEIVATGARLVVIDPLDSMMGKADTGSSASVRHTALTRLTHIAERTGATIIFLGHPPKATNGIALHAFVGSQAFVAACRVAMIVGPDPNDDSRLVLAVSKSNWGAKPDSLYYTYESSVEGDRQAPPVIRWHGPSELTADELVNRDRAPEPGSVIERATEAILEALKHGPQPAASMESVRVAQRIGQQAFKKARARLAESGAIEQFREGFQGETRWRLRQTGTPDADPAPVSLFENSGENESVVHSDSGFAAGPDRADVPPDQLPPMAVEVPAGFKVGEL